MTGAGRLSSGPQPVTVNAAPLFLLCIIHRDTHQACANGAPPQRKMAPGEREHSDPKGHAGPSAARRPVNSGTRDRSSDSDRQRRAPVPSAPGDELRSLCARDRSRNGRDAAARFTRVRCGEAARAQRQKQSNELGVTPKLLSSQMIPIRAPIPGKCTMFSITGTRSFPS